MSYKKETEKASQDAYFEARKFGHTKEEARSIRDNWKESKTSNDSVSSYSDDECDDLPEPYSQDCIDD